MRTGADRRREAGCNPRTRVGRAATLEALQLFRCVLVNAIVTPALLVLHPVDDICALRVVEAVVEGRQDSILGLLGSCCSCLPLPAKLTLLALRVMLALFPLLYFTLHFDLFYFFVVFACICSDLFCTVFSFSVKLQFQ